MLHSTGMRNDMLTATHGVGSGTFNSGAINVYTGAAPGTADAAETGTKLASVALPATTFPAPSSGVLTANAITGSTILASGTAGYGRVVTSTDTGVLSTTQDRLQFSVGTSGTELVLNTTTLTVGGTITVTAFTYTAPS